MTRRAMQQHPDSLKPTAHERLPQDPEARAILDERAELLAENWLVGDESESAEQYLRFRLGATENYGIPYAFLDEILYVNSVAKVPCTPAFIHGVVNRRGELLTVLDLKQFFRVPQDADYDEEARIVIVRGNDLCVGLLVNEVIGNEEYLPSQLGQPLPSLGVTKLEYVRGIYDGTVTILDMEAMLSEPQLIINETTI